MDRFAGVELLDTVCGLGNYPSLRAREYPCVRRLRHRRLVTFLWLQGHDEAAQLMVRDTCTLFSAKDLRVLVEQGQWRDAVDYLSRFLPKEADTWGVVASVLHRFLAVHMDLADIVAGVKFGQDRLAVLHREYFGQNLKVTFCRGTSRLRSMIFNIIRKRQQARASLDWELVRCSAGEIVENLVYRTPELRDLALLPGGPMHPHNVLPIWSRFRQRSHGKKKKQAGGRRRLRASALAKVYVQHRKSLPSLSQEPPEELRRKTLNWVADILYESLSAGKRLENPLQTSGKEGASYNPIPGTPYKLKPLSKNMFGTSTDDATNFFVTSSARGAENTFI